jgi:hypothetical protein
MPRRAVRQDHHVDEPVPIQPMPQPARGLIVEHDRAELRYAAGQYHPTQRRRIRNVGTEPVTRYLVRISLDRHPRRPRMLQRAVPATPAHLGRAGAVRPRRETTS